MDIGLPALLFLAVTLLPVGVAPLLHRSARACSIAPWIPATAIILLPLQGTSVDFPWLLLGTRIGLTTEFVPLLLLAIVVWTAAGWHARRTLPATGRDRFWFFWLATWCGNLCVLLTQDAASFYAAYAMMTFAAWGLVVHQQRAADFRAGRVYLVMALIGEALLITALLAIGARAGNIELANAGAIIAELPERQWIVALLAAGFGVKMGLAGLHMWLPLAHPQAPVPASAVLSGVILKAGLAGWLLFLPLGAIGFTTAGHGLIAAGIVTAFYGVAVGLCQDRAKTILAYSSLSQMGLVTVAVGIALAYPETAAGFTTIAVLFAVHHGLAKGALFLGVDLTRASPRMARALLWLPAASLAGLPLTSGALAKATLKADLPSALAPWLEPLLILSSIATTLLLVRFLLRAWPERGAIAQGARPWPWLLLLIASLVLPWLLAGAHDLTWIRQPWSPANLFAATLPVIIGVIIGMGAWRLRMAGPTLPEGDLVALARYWQWRPGLRAPRSPRISLPRNPLPALERRLTVFTVALLTWSAVLTGLTLLTIRGTG